MSDERTLSRTGERDTELSVGSATNVKSSYTAQPLISRAGRVIGNLLLCLKEWTGTFGPRVMRDVRDLTNELGNIEVFSSTSGKMSSVLMKAWLTWVLKPALLKEPLIANNVTSSSDDAEFANEVCAEETMDRSCIKSTAPGPSWLSDNVDQAERSQILRRFAA